MLKQLRFLRLFTVSVVLIFVAIQPSFSPSQTAYAAPSVSISSIGNTAQGEDLDYAAHDWHDAWDMNQESDMYIFQSPTCDPSFGQPQFNSISFSGGVFSANTNTSDAWMWLIHPGYGGALHVGRDGFVHPIDASKYTQLTFRMYMSNAPANGTHLRWTDSDTSQFGVPAHYALTKYFRAYSGWNIYTIDLSRIGYIPAANGGGNLTWSGNIRGLALFTGDSSSGTNVKIDWVRLTPKPSRTVQWTGTWQSSATAQLYFSSDNFSTVNDPVYSFSTNPNGSFTTPPDVLTAGSDGHSGSYAVPASFPAGSQYIKVKVTDGTGPTTSNSAGPWQFNALPPFSFVAPSYSSGDDFATKVVGNAWDMSDSADVSSWNHLAGPPSFSNGIMTATSVTGSANCQAPWGDPSIFLNMNGQSINTSYYHYLTVKVKVDANFDFGNGWVSRIIWGTNTPNNFGYGDDMALYQNPVSQSYWNVFQLDMSAGDIRETDPGQGGNLSWLGGSPTYFRFDPFEIPPSTPFEIDSITLTANDNAPRNSSFQIKYLLNPSLIATFYYDTDQNPSNGRSALAALAPSRSGSSSSGPSKIFLPFILGISSGSSGPGDPPGTRILNWNLNGVPGNAYYYISADVNDGFNTTTWYSDTPVFIKP